MARKFKVRNEEYNCIKLCQSNTGPITITFVKHDIGTWNAGIEEFNTWVHANTKEEALFLLMVKHFGRKV